MRAPLLITFLLVIQFVVAQSRLDSLQALIDTHTAEDTTRVNILNELSNQHQWIDFFASLSFAEQALKLSEKLSYEKGIATAYYRIGHCYWALGDVELAIEKGLEAASLAEKEKLVAVLGESYQILTRAYMDQREVTKATYYNKKAEAIALQTNNWDFLSRVYNLTGVIQFIKSNEDSALLFYTKALKIMNEHPGPKLHLPQVTSNIGECYFKKDLDKAFKYFYQALEIAKATKNRSTEAGTSSIVGNALIKVGKYKEAEKYLTQSLRLSRKLGLRRVIRHAYAGLADLKVHEGKPEEALAYMKSYYDVRDSLFNMTKTRKIVEMESRHELESKEQAIKLLEQERRIQKIWTSTIITGLLIVAAFSLVLFYQQKYRNKKNREILNLQIDSLTSENKVLSDKYKSALLIDVDETAIESIDQRLLKKAIELVETNLSDRLFGVEQLARELGMSRTNMHRKLKEITGVPPSELIRNIRLRRAAVLLIKKADSVSQISLTVGFEDHSYFTKAFKKHFGVTPSEYLQSREHMN
jgi:AraC-like DNA-binding protein